MISITNKFIRTAPRKIRLMLDAIKGMPVMDAESRLRFANNQAARDVYLSLHSAIAAAKDRGFEPSNWTVIKAIGEEGPRIKRRIMASRGRARPIAKQMSHIRITIGAKTNSTNTTATQEVEK